MRVPPLDHLSIFNSVTNNSNNSYDNLDYTESERKGRAVCPIWLQGGIHNETPTDKNKSPPGTFGPPPPPPSLKKKELGANQVPR